MKKNKIMNYLIFTFLMFLGSAVVVNAAGNEYIACGNNSIPAPIAPITRTVVLLLQIILPLGIIIVGSLDFLKAVAAADQEKIKKNQHQFFNRLKAGGIFFFVIVIIKFIVSIMADASDSSSLADCIDCMISDSTKCGEITTNSPFLDK